MAFLTTSEVATALRLHPNTVRKFVSDGTLPAFRIGTQYRVDAAELARYLRACCNASSSQSVSETQTQA